MKKQFEVGDRVRIRQWDDMEREFGRDWFRNIKVYCSFTQAMKHLCGREATIEEIKGNCVWLKDWSDESGYIDFIFSTDMIEHVEEADSPKYTTAIKPTLTG